MNIVIANEKGGVGKTTLAVNLAVMFARAGTVFQLVDADRQGSSALWSNIRDDAGHEPQIKTLRYTKPHLHKEIKNSIIDVGGRDSEILRSALLAADLVLIPSRPTQFDLWGLDTMNDLIGTARHFNQGVRALVVWCMASAIPQVKDDHDAAELVNDFENLILAKSIIRNRIAYGRSITEGQAVAEYEPRGKAALEMNQLFEEIRGANVKIQTKTATT